MKDMCVLEATMLSSQKNSVMEILNKLHSFYGIEHVNICYCGAFTFEKNGQDVSVEPKNASKFFPLISQDEFFELQKRVVPNYSNCNHCVNHWGLDLCKCGSGYAPDECTEEFENCGTPAQDLGGFLYG